MLDWIRWQWFKARHKHDPGKSLVGNGATGPDWNFIARCCMCGRVRFAARMYEMYGEDGGWWHSCQNCAVSELARQLEEVKE